MDRMAPSGVIIFVGSAELSLTFSRLPFGQNDRQNHETAARQKARQVRLFPENNEGGQYREGYFNVVEHGQGAGIGLQGAFVPEEKTQTGGQKSKVKQDHDLHPGQVHDIMPALGGGGRDGGNYNCAQIEQGVYFPVPQILVLTANPPVFDLAEGKTHIGGLHEEKAHQNAMVRDGLVSNQSRPDNGQQSQTEVKYLQPAGINIVDESHINGSKNGKESHLISLQEPKGVEVSAVHETKLHRADADQPHGQHRGQHFMAQKRQKQGKGQEHSSPGHKIGIDPFQVMFDQPER